MCREEVNIICYGDDAVFIANTEDDFQFITHRTSFNVKVSKEKTKCVTVFKEPIRCKLEIEVHSIKQVMIHDYLGVNILSARDLNQEVKKQEIKGVP